MAKRFAAPAAIAALCLALAACGTPSTEPSNPSTNPSTPGPSASAAAGAPLDNPFLFTADTAAGGTLDGETLMGEDVILWFWAPWCPICLVEGKDYVAEAIAQLPEGVELVGVAGQITSDEEVGEFLDYTGTGDATHVLDVDGELWADFGVLLQPAFIFVNDDGTARRSGGGLTTEEILEHAERLAST